jgi:hypothetical protein
VQKKNAPGAKANAAPLPSPPSVGADLSSDKERLGCRMLGSVLAFLNV